MSANFFQVQSKTLNSIFANVLAGDGLESEHLTLALEQAFEEAPSDTQFDLLVSDFLFTHEMTRAEQPPREQRYELVIEDFKRKHQELVSTR